MLFQMSLHRTATCTIMISFEIPTLISFGLRENIILMDHKSSEDDISVIFGISENDAGYDRLNYLTHSWQICLNKVEDEKLVMKQ